VIYKQGSGEVSALKCVVYELIWVSQSEIMFKSSAGTTQRCILG
jgi:hypothetical protein